MYSITRKIPSLSRVFTTLKLTKVVTLSRYLCTTMVSRTQKLERIAEELLDLVKIERYDYSIFFLHKMGHTRFVLALSGPTPTGSATSGFGSAEIKAVKKTMFDVKFEKYDQLAKIKIIKEVKMFTGLVLKEYKDLVDEAHAIIKKGVTKEEANKIVDKLKELGVIVVLE